MKRINQNNKISDLDKILLPYKRPSSDLLDQSSDDNIDKFEEETVATTGKLKEIFAEFDVDAKIGNVTRNSMITCCEVHLASGIEMNKIINFENEIATAMQTKSIRVVAPTSGKNTVKIELPNQTRQIVTYSQIVHTDEYVKANNEMTIPLSLGQTIDREVFIIDLVKTTHLLVAGATGAGKSVCINTILMSILLKFKPNELKLILVDPKHVELVPYHNLSHLLFPVLCLPDEICNALDWLVDEMIFRYKYFAKLGVKNIQIFNEKRKNDKRTLKVKSDTETRNIPEFLPYIVLIIDELSDLMTGAKSEAERRIIRLVQLAEATGIHMIIATQRPSTNIITGLIKANIPARIAFRTISNIDSRVILGQIGCEKLLGFGDMLYKSPDLDSAVRHHGFYVSEDEVKNVTDFIREQRQPDYINLEIIKVKQQNEEI